MVRILVVVAIASARTAVADPAPSIGAGRPAEPAPPGTHALRVDAITGFPIPVVFPHVSLGLIYAYAPTSRLALEGMLGYGASGPEVGVGAKLRYLASRRMFVGVGANVILDPSGPTHDVFAPYPGYLVTTDLLGWEKRWREGAIVTVALGTVTIVHAYDEPSFVGWTGPRFYVGIGRWF